MTLLPEFKETRAVIWDEVSMSSQRMLEIVNRIHHKVFENDLPFGGVQMILVGDFLQLKPIPSSLDPGNMMFNSDVFNTAFPHRVELNTVVRQDPEQLEYKSALRDLRYGNCSKNTEEFLRSLSRPIPDNQAVHIYFKRLPVLQHNFSTLMSLAGEMITFESEDNGNVTALDNTISKTLHLKEGCGVMLLYNVNQSLHNGSRGIFVRADSPDEITVRFPRTGENYD